MDPNQMRKLLDIAETSNVPELAESEDDMLRRMVSGGLSGETYAVSDDHYTLGGLAPIELKEDGELVAYYLEGDVNNRYVWEDVDKWSEHEENVEGTIVDGSTISLYRLPDGMYEWSAYGEMDIMNNEVSFDGIDGKNNASPVAALNSCLTRLSSILQDKVLKMELPLPQEDPDIDYDPETGMASDGRHSRFVGFGKNW